MKCCDTLERCCYWREAKEREGVEEGGWKKAEGVKEEGKGRREKAILSNRNPLERAGGC